MNMLLKLIVGILIVALVWTAIAHGQTYEATGSGVFYREENVDFNVIGHYETKANDGSAVNGRCFIERNYGDGSSFALIIDLNDKEIYMMIVNKGWNLKEKHGTVDDFVLMSIVNNKIKRQAMKYQVIDATKILVRDLPFGVFQLLETSTDIKFVMPDHINDAEIEMTGIKLAMDQLRECYITFEENEEMNKKPAPKKKGTKS
jgi:hypothetical protein